ncbi:FAS1 domain-containing protein [Morchella snyderi]|nr:FAS1 domain-containing protein [Morchella snyderi]
MTNSLILPAFLIFSSIVRPIFAQFDIIDICKQTPEMTAWGEYLENNPDIYNQYYADVRDKSIFIPSNKALEAYYNTTKNTLQERGNVFVDQNLFVADNFDPAGYANTRVDRRTSTQRKRANTESNREGEPITLRTAAKGLNLRNLFIGMVFGDSSKDSKRLKERSFEDPPEPKPAGIVVSTGLGKKSSILFGSLMSTQGTLWVIDDIFEFPETVSSSLSKTESSEFLGAVEAAGFQEKYDTADQITIFAPIDGSYNSSCSCSLTTAAVEAHVVYGAALYNSVLKDGTEFQTCQGKKLKITIQDGVTYVNGVKIIERDIITLNGVIHTLERPLVESDYDEYEGTTTTEATPIATEYQTYYQPSTTVVEVQVTSTPVPVTTSVPAANTTTPLANATATPLPFTGSASVLGKVDLRVTFGTFVLALAVFIF